MSKKYIDNRAIIQVLGTIFKTPYLLDEQDRYFISTDDFVEPFHKLIYSTIFNLRVQGAGKIELLDIDNYLASKPGLHKIYNDNKGAEYLVEASGVAEFDNFNYYFNRLKKFSLLRGLNNMGIDMRGLYDPDELFDAKKIKEQAEWLDNVKLEEIPSIVNDKIEAVKHEYLGRMMGDGQKMGLGALELIEKLQETPEIGIPLYGNYINKITRGARLKKFYLRSAPSGVGKSRMMMADACNFACDEIYQNGKWIANGQKEPTLFITTELEIDECQTMAMAFLSDVNEDHILDGKYHKGEIDRVRKAANLLNNSPIWVEHMPDFSLSDIEGVIKRHVRENGVKYVVYDYIHTSMKILEEITKRSGGVKLREDNILFMLAIRLKDLANELGVFIMSATQLNGK